MMRAMSLEPEAVIGFDTSQLFYYQFQALQRYWKEQSCHYIPLGWQALDCFSTCFDLVLCMGVLYHCREPLDLLKKQ